MATLEQLTARIFLERSPCDGCANCARCLPAQLACSSFAMFVHGLPLARWLTAPRVDATAWRFEALAAEIRAAQQPRAARLTAAQLRAERARMAARRRQLAELARRVSCVSRIRPSESNALGGKGLHVLREELSTA